jgi:hypothetical protein
MGRERTKTAALTSATSTVRAFYERHPHPKPLDNLDRHREIYKNPITAGHGRFCCG